MVAERTITQEQASRAAYDMLQIPQVRDAVGEFVDLRNRYQKEIDRVFDETPFGKTPYIKPVVDRFEPRLKALDEKVLDLIKENLDG